MILMKQVLSIIFLSALALATRAQKLPSVQTSSVIAPNNIKIDGSPMEWTGGFQAYNGATEIYYTIANDNECLYLVVQATDDGIIQKIVAGGITLTLRSADKKSTVMPATISYPIVPAVYSQGVSYKLRTNKILSAAQLQALNTQISGHIKEIPITGARGIADSSVSVYNDLGIKAAGLIDKQKIYTCEIALPLKYIQQVFDASGSCRYRLQVNGLDTSGKDGIIVIGGKAVNASDEPVDHGASYFLTSPTYLQGVYTLAK